MSVSFASFRLGIAELAILGLIAPAECDDLPAWSVEEKKIFRRAADLVLRGGETIPCPLGDGRDALTDARQVVEDMDPEWWPHVIVSDDPGASVATPIHDLTLVALWGAEWLLAQMTLRGLLGADPAVQAVELFLDQAEGRLEVLRACQRDGLVADDVSSLEVACDDLSDALTEAGPVFILWPATEPEPV
ncbi:hypothetical protein JRX38_06060 [Gluconobacter cerinus]|uniref:hypothetical protein n=1 Tax=Gluconobacter cerinus TaxID=38307 RepID=UPI00193EE24A|nr:hypothetical protein [Gluconobacter cerinus]MBM3097585.1 hypothetical protein [Gluconobacter cerinus]